MSVNNLAAIFGPIIMNVDKVTVILSLINHIVTRLFSTYRENKLEIVSSSMQ